jgi:hypothetical protein
MFSISYMGESGPTLDPWICSSSESEPLKADGRPPGHKDAIVQSDALFYYNTAQLYCTLQLNFFTSNSLFLVTYLLAFLDIATSYPPCPHYPQTRAINFFDQETLPIVLSSLGRKRSRSIAKLFVLIL